MSGPKAPKPPDPQETAAAQTSTNFGTAIANNAMGMVDQITPYGNLTYNQTGTQTYTDPYTGEVYEIPRYSATTSLTPEQQAVLDANNQASVSLSNLAADRAGFLQDYLGNTMDGSTLPNRGSIPNAPNLNTSAVQAPNLNTDAVTPRALNFNVPQTGELATSFDRVNFGGGGEIINRDVNSWDITRSYGANDFSEDRQRVEDALMQRMQPQIDRDREAMLTRLANQGIGVGSEAFSDSQFNFDRGVNDARLGAILSAGQEQSRMVGMDRERAMFENSAQAQGFGQDLANIQQRNAAQNQGFQQAFSSQQAEAQQRLALAQLQNAAEGQRFGQDLASLNAFNSAAGQEFGLNLASQQAQNDALSLGFGQQLTSQQAQNNAQLQGFGADMSAAQAQDAQRAQALQEQFALRNQPINEITALLSGSQVNAPNFNGYTPQGAATTDVAGLINQNYAQEYLNYANSVNNRNSLLGGFLGAGATLLGAPSGSLLGGMVLR